MLDASSKVVGDTIRLGNGAHVYDVHYNELINPQGTIMGSEFTPLAIPVLTLPALPTITPGATAIVVAPRHTHILDAGHYDEITVRAQGTLILTGGIYHISCLRLHELAQVLCKMPSEIRVRDWVHTEARATIGPDLTVLQPPTAAEIVFLVAGCDNAVHIGKQNTILANLYAPNGDVTLLEKTQGTGAFIGDQVLIGQRVELTLDSAF